MARLDARRIAAWRGLQALVGELERGLDDELRADWDIPLGWFDVLASLQRLGGRARPHDIAADLRLPASSLSRRLDRLAEEGWVARHREVPGADGHRHHQAVATDTLVEAPHGETVLRHVVSASMVGPTRRA